MGTSTSERSPDTASWRAVQAMYRSDFPIARVAHEVWRAAANDAEAEWTRALGSPAVAVCRDFALEAEDPAVAVADASRVIALDHEATFAAELAKLALANSAGGPTPSERFVRELFEFTTEYLVSRDLSGFVGRRYRNRTVGQAADFRRRVREEVGERVDLIGRDLRRSEASSWPRTVQAIVHRLSMPNGHAR